MPMYPKLAPITNEQYGWFRDALPRFKRRVDDIWMYINGIIDTLNDPVSYFMNFPTVETFTAVGGSTNLVNQISHDQDTTFTFNGSGFDGEGRAYLNLHDEVGGDNEVTIMALRSGECDLRIEIIEPEADNTDLDVSYDDGLITVLLGKTGGNVTTNYTALKAEMETVDDTDERVFIFINGAGGDEIVEAIEETELTGGVGEQLRVLIGGYEALQLASVYTAASAVPSETTLMCVSEHGVVGANTTLILTIYAGSRQSFPIQLGSVQTI